MIDHLLRSLKDYSGFWAMYVLTLLFTFSVALWFWFRLRGVETQFRQRLNRHAERIQFLEHRMAAQEMGNAQQKGTESRARQVESKPQQSPKQTTSQPQQTRLMPDRAVRDRHGVDANPAERELAHHAAASPEEEWQFEGGRLPPRPQPVIYYAAVPEADGTFKESQLSREAQYDTLYRLDVALDGKTASLGLHRNPDAFRAALESPRRYLDPACSYKELSSTGAMAIVESRPGLAVMEDARWRVQRKIEVEFQ